MNTKKVIILIMKLPIVALMLISWGASFYAAYKHINNISYATPIIFTIIVACYVLALYLEKKNKIIEEV